MYTVKYKEAYSEDTLHFLGIFSDWDKAAQAASSLGIDTPIIEETLVDPYIKLIEDGYFPFVIDVKKGKNIEYAVMARTPDNMVNTVTHQILSQKKGDDTLRITCIAQNRNEAARIVASVMNDLGWKL